MSADYNLTANELFALDNITSRCGIRNVLMALSEISGKVCSVARVPSERAEWAGIEAALTDLVATIDRQSAARLGPNWSIGKDGIPRRREI